MRLDVSLEVTEQRKLLVTPRTLMRFVPRMKHHVVLQVGLLAESFVTHLAAVRPGAVVNVHVRAQVARGGERLGATRAFVRLFLGKDHTMINAMTYATFICNRCTMCS